MSLTAHPGNSVWYLASWHLLSSKLASHLTTYPSPLVPSGDVLTLESATRDPTVLPWWLCYLPASSYPSKCLQSHPQIFLLNATEITHMSWSADSWSPSLSHASHTWWGRDTHGTGKQWTVGEGLTQASAVGFRMGISGSFRQQSLTSLQWINQNPPEPRDDLMGKVLYIQAWEPEWILDR